MNTDTNKYTILFAIGMVIVVGSLLAFTASSLAPNIDVNKRLEKQQNILYAMGINENTSSSAKFVSTEKAPDLFKQYIVEQIIIQGGDISTSEDAYLIDVKKQQANSKAGIERKLPLFVGEKENEKFYIAPIRGKGLLGLCLHGLKHGHSRGLL